MSALRATGSEIHRTITEVFRRESARLVAALTRLTRDLDLAEELAQDALLAALEQWPGDGLPDNPGAWLMGVAKHRGLNALRRRRMLDRKHDALAREAPVADEPADVEAMIDDDIGDDLLRLVFVSCHPLLAVESRVALTLRLLGGLTTEEIARAFLVPEPTIAQRIVRAKRTLSEAKVPFEVPRGPELSERLAAVLGVVYLVFNEGYSATAGDDWMRPHLCEDARHLGRLLAEVAPAEPEVHGLLALMELNASRSEARTGPGGEPVLLLDQDRSRWDAAAIARGLAALARAEALGGAAGPYALQAAVVACHARAAVAAETDWARIAALYGEMSRRTPSPVVEINRAVAVSMAQGPAAGLAVLDAIGEVPALARYHLLPSVRGDLLFKLGRFDEARAELARAANLTKNERERALLLGRVEACDHAQS